MADEMRHVLYFFRGETMTELINKELDSFTDKLVGLNYAYSCVLCEGEWSKEVVKPLDFNGFRRGHYPYRY